MLTQTVLLLFFGGVVVLPKFVWNLFFKTLNHVLKAFKSLSLNFNINYPNTIFVCLVINFIFFNFFFILLFFYSNRSSLILQHTRKNLILELSIVKSVWIFFLSYDMTLKLIFFHNLHVVKIFITISRTYINTRTNISPNINYCCHCF